MPRTTVTLTAAWQSLAVSPAVVTVRSAAPGAQLALNDAEDSATAMLVTARPGDQFVQSETKNTFAKGDGIVVTVDAQG